MSYCVNCGVELDESAEKCALCGTEIFIPDNRKNEPVQTPFSSVPEIPKSVKRTFIASIVSVCMFIPNVICSLFNIFIKTHGYWSVYVNCTSILVWVLLVFPFLSKKTRPYLLWAFDTIATMVYTYVFFPLQREDPRLYHRIALPIIISVSLCVLVFIFWARKKPRHWSSLIIHLFIDVCVVSAVICAICLLWSTQVGASVCMIVFLSSLSLAVFGIYCNRSRHIRKWMAKKFFV